MWDLVLSCLTYESSVLILSNLSHLSVCASYQDQLKFLRTCVSLEQRLAAGGVENEEQACGHQQVVQSHFMTYQQKKGQETEPPK